MRLVATSVQPPRFPSFTRLPCILPHLSTPNLEVPRNFQTIKRRLSGFGRKDLELRPCLSGDFSVANYGPTTLGRGVGIISQPTCVILDQCLSVPWCLLHYPHHSCASSAAIFLPSWTSWPSFPTVPRPPVPAPLSSSLIALFYSCILFLLVPMPSPPSSSQHVHASIHRNAK